MESNLAAVQAEIPAGACGPRLKGREGVMQRAELATGPA